MCIWKRVLALFVMLAMLVPMAAVGESELPGVPEEAEVVTGMQEAEVSVQDDVVLGEDGAVSGSGAIDYDALAKADGAPVRVDENVYVNSTSVDLYYNVNDIVRIWVNLGDGSKVKSWKSAKKKIVPQPEFTPLGDFATFRPAAEGDSKLTATMDNKRKVIVNMHVTDPYQPSSITFNGGNTVTLTAGEQFNLYDRVIIEPSWLKVRDLVSSKALDIKMPKTLTLAADGTVSTSKNGKAKITLTCTANKKKKATLNVVVQNNKVEGLVAKPTAADVADVDGWTLLLEKAEVTNKGLTCQLYLLNNTGDKVSAIEDLNIALAVGTPSNVVASYNGVLKASVASGKSKALKVNMAITGSIPPLPRSTCYFIFNKGSLKGKNGSYEDFDFDATNIEPSPSAPDSITVEPGEASVKIGESAQLYAEVGPDTATDKGVIWSSDNPAVATVSNTGLVTGVSAGKATITATAHGNSRLTDTCTVTVKAEQAFTMVNGVVTGYKGDGGAIVIPQLDEKGNTVTEIGANALAGNRSITDVSIHRSIKKIGAGAFAGCTGLTTVTIPDTVETIEAGAFDRSVVINSSIGKAGYEYAFDNGNEYNVLGTFDLNGISISGDAIVVTTRVSSQCELQVFVLNEEQTEELFSATLNLIPDPKTQEIPIKISGMTKVPEYCTLKAVLVDSHKKPIGEPMLFLERTEKFTMFDAKTPDSYKDRTIINQGSSGFAVMDGATLQVTCEEIMSNSYRVKSATKPWPGAKLDFSDLSIQFIVDDGNSVSTNADGTYTVRKNVEASINELLDFCRLRDVTDIINAIGFASKNLIRKNGSSLTYYSDSFTDGLFTANYVIGAQLVFHVYLDNDLYDTNWLNIEAYIEFEGDVDYIMSAAGSYKGVVPVFAGTIHPSERMKIFKSNLGLNIPVDINAEGPMTLSTSFSGKLGFSYNQSSGMTNICEYDMDHGLTTKDLATVVATPTFTMSFDADEMLQTSVVGALDARMEMMDTTESSIDANAEMITGIAANGTYNANLPDRQHQCDVCYDVDFYTTANVQAEFSGNKYAKKKTDFESQTYEGLYLSVDHDSDSPFHNTTPVYSDGLCPNYKYLTVIHTLDYDGKPTGSPLDVTIYTRNGDKTERLQTIKSETAVYLYPGSYQVSAYYDGGSLETVDFDVTNSFCEVTLKPKATGKISGVIYEAESDLGMPGVTVSCGTKSTTTDSEGAFEMEVPPAAYTLKISADGYVTQEVPLIVEPDCEYEIYRVLTPYIPNAIRVDLNWGEEPSDLDAHLECADYNISIFDEHIVYDDESNTVAVLDHDCTTGYGPETITFVPQPGVTYTYYVHDYVNSYNYYNSNPDPRSEALANSGATIGVHLPNGESMYFKVPRGYGNRWYVFEYKDGVFKTNDTIIYVDTSAQSNSQARIKGYKAK